MTFKVSAVGVQYHFVVYLFLIVSVFCATVKYQEHCLLRCDAV